MQRGMPEEFICWLVVVEDEVRVSKNAIVNSFSRGLDWEMWDQSCWRGIDWVELSEYILEVEEFKRDEWVVVVEAEDIV